MVTFFFGYQAKICSAWGVVGDDVCSSAPTRLVLVDGLWLGGAACEDEQHAAIVVSWTLEHVDRYGSGGGVPLRALQAVVRAGR